MPALRRIGSVAVASLSRNTEGSAMPASFVHQCQCRLCHSPAPHPDKLRHRQMNLFLSRLDEQQRRWYVGLESLHLGEGSDAVLSRITGMDEKTIRRGRQEVEQEFSGRPEDKVRLPGAGRPLLEVKIPR
jgi:hypothetical protein